jgi:hypothetical protein
LLKCVGKKNEISCRVEYKNFKTLKNTQYWVFLSKKKSAGKEVEKDLNLPNYKFIKQKKAPSF